MVIFLVFPCNEAVVFNFGMLTKKAMVMVIGGDKFLCRHTITVLSLGWP